MHRSDPAFAPGRILTCGVLAAFVFSSRAWLIQGWGSPLPRLDQWDVEALGLILPWLEGRFEWSSLFTAHNEHRLALTRLTALAWFAGSGAWSMWSQMLFNALLHAATAAALAALFWPALPARSRAGFTLGVTLLFAATAGWQNALWGFQSQVYFANLLTVLAAASLSARSSCGLRRWLGNAALVLALFANAAGLLGAISIAAVALLAAIDVRPGDARTWFATLFPLAIVALGLALRVEPAHHASLHARNVEEFWAVFSRGLAWPFVNTGGLALLTSAPLAFIVFGRWYRREPLDPAERAALALSLFAALSAAAVAYGRGAGLPEARPLSRYQDPLLLGSAAQLFAVLRIALNHGRPGRLLALGWCTLMLAGLITLTTTNFTLNLSYTRVQDQANLAAIRSYGATGDAAALAPASVARAVHPDPKVLRQVLDAPVLRAVLPPELSGVEASPPLPWAIRHGRILTLVAGLSLAALLLCQSGIRSDRADQTVPPQSRP